MTQDPQNHGNEQEIDLAKKIKEAKEKAEKEKSAQTTSNSKADIELATLRAELERITEMAKRTMADLQNLKRRQEEERRVIITMANVDLIKSLLPIVDNLDRAKQHVPEGAETWFKGIEMCTNQLHKLLNDSGLKPIESLNQPFNPDFHEALAEGPGPKDTVVEELEKGYLLGDRVVRHAKVKVGNGEGQK